VGHRVILLFTLVVVVLAVALFFQVIDREQTPPWADSPGGTLMVSVLVEDQRATGFQYVLQRPDPISPATREITARLADLSDEDEDARARQAFLRVRMLDTDGTPLGVQFVPDPLPGFREAPGRSKDDPALFWAGKGEPDEYGAEPGLGTFLLAVPNLKGLRSLELTRFGSDGEEIDAGLIDLWRDRRSPRHTAAAGLIPLAHAFTLYNAEDGEIETVVDNGDPEDRLDILILAEGFRNTNAHRDRFRQKVQEALDYLWSIPAYNELRASFNVHTAFLASTEAGSDHPSDGVNRDTAFETYYDCFGVERLICVGFWGTNMANAVAALAPGNYGLGSLDVIAVLVNDPQYGGGGGGILTFSADEAAPEIFAHELGHTAFGLADEYESEYNGLMEFVASFGPNVSGAVGDRDQLKWIDLVDPGTDIPTQQDPGGCTRSSGCSASTLPAGTVGMYEGAGYTACGNFRPTTSCIMRCNGRDFCPVCRREVERVLEPLTPQADIYIRDNRLDNGNAPSPSGVEDPPGSGDRVYAYQSVDVRVDAPPFEDGAATHENPIAGTVNRVYVTVHNRGNDPADERTDVFLYVARATGGAPLFPDTDLWKPVGTSPPGTDIVVGREAFVPGQGGRATVFFEWDAPADADPHTCALVTASGDNDPMFAPQGSLGQFVRGQNNVSWKNLHVVRTNVIEFEVSSFVNEETRIVLRIEAASLPPGSSFRLEHQPALVFTPFDSEDARQMTIETQTEAEVRFIREDATQQFLALQTTLPAGEGLKHFASTARLHVFPPGGTATGSSFQVTINQFGFDPRTTETGSEVLGALIGGNTYTVILE
jgi:hypothetical protein